MLARTHIAFGISVGLIYISIIIPDSIIIFFSGLMLGTLMVDIDRPNSKIGIKTKPLSDIFSILFGHRGFFHSIFAAILLSGPIWYFLSKEFGLAFLIGYISHILIDGLTEAGVNLLHPFANLRIAGFIKTGSIFEHFLLVALLFFIATRIF
jgi:inner membrane protein